MAEAMNENNHIQDQTSKRSRNALLGILAIVGAVAACVIVAIAAILSIDPFGWNLYDQLFGGPDLVTKAMPADTSIFVGFNLAELTPTKIGRVIDPFLAIGEDQDVKDYDSGFDELDSRLVEDYEISIEDDILSWLGRYAGLGITTQNLGEFGEPDQFNWSLVVSTRNEKASDDFMAKLRDAISQESGHEFTSSIYDDITIYELDTTDEFQKLVMARDDGLIFFSAGTDRIQANIDAQGGSSLGENESYRQLEEVLPDNRAFTFFVDSSFYDSLLEEFGQAFPLEENPAALPGLGEFSVAFGLSLTDDGLQLDTANLLSPETMTQAARDFYSSEYPEPLSAEYFPGTTLVYYTGQRLDVIWSMLREYMATDLDPMEFDEAMEEIAREIGINPDTQLFPLLDGEWSFGVMPSTSGMLPAELDVNLGMAMIAQTSDPDSLSDNLADVAVALGSWEYDELSTDGSKIYAFEPDSSIPPLLNFGIKQNALVISTDPDTIDQLFSEAPSLADLDRYQAAWDSFESGMSPSFYLDLNGLLGTIREGLDPETRQDFEETAQYLQPITTIAVAGEHSGDVVHSTAIVFIEAID